MPDLTNRLIHRGLVKIEAKHYGAIMEHSAEYLKKLNGCTHINPNSSYITFQTSLTYGPFVATGVITFTNNGDTNVNLVSHSPRCSRSGHMIGGSYDLAPNKRQAFDFRGSWFIEIKNGDCEKILVGGFTTSGGGAGDWLGMCRK